MLTRKLALAGTVLMFSAASFQTPTYNQIGFVGRFIFALVLLGFTVAERGQGKRPSGSFPRAAQILMFGFWTLCALAFASSVWSLNPDQTLLQASILALLAGNMHVHIKYRWLHDRLIREDIRIIFVALAATVLGSLVLGTVVGGRLAGLFSNANTLGIVAALTVALGVGIYLEGRSRTVLVILVLVFAAIVMTESRTALITSVMVVAWAIVRQPPSLGKMALTSLLGAVVVVGVIVGPDLPLPEVIDRLSGPQQNGLLNDRSTAWNYALRLWHEHRWGGVGFRVGEVAFQENRGTTGFRYDGAHSSYLQMLLELGIVGCLVCVVIVSALSLSTLRMTTHGLGGGLSALLLVGLAIAFTESALFGVGQVFCWVFWMASAAGACLSPREEPDVLVTPGRARHVR